MYKHFLQSSSWQTFEESLGKTTFAESSDTFAFLALLERTKLGNYLYLPYGPALDETAPKKAFQDALKALISLAKREHAFFIRVEPTTALVPSTLVKLGFKKSKNLNPADTWALDLTQTKEEILTHMSQGTRTRHNQFPKKGLSVEVSQDPKDIKHLVRLQHKLAKERHINIFSEAYLRAELSQPFASLYLVHFQDPADNQDKIISASLVFDDSENSTRFYMQAATDSAYKKLPATVGLLTTSLFDAKEKGLKSFDFWGIAPDDAPKTHPWAGFTEFKKSFGGSPVHYSGTWDLPLDKPKYRLYSLLRSANRTLRKNRFLKFQSSSRKRE